jgi:4-hydroxy-tetrahydrodipicolinate reductase
MAKKQTGVIVSGAYGRMGRQVVCAVTAEPDMRVAGALDMFGCGQDAGEAAGLKPLGVCITDDLKGVVRTPGAQVMVDFAVANGFWTRAKAALDAGLRLVVGTTGIASADLKKVEKLAADKKLGVIVAPNFAIGAVLMMQFAQKAAQFMPAVEIIELHHDQKRDAPSGTALYTAELIAAAKKGMPAHKDPTEVEKLKGVRGGKLADIAVHSVRLPGFLAHQEVIFGGLAQTLTIRHDTASRESFMPGVVLAVRKSLSLKGYVFGLEKVI